MMTKVGAYSFSVYFNQKECHMILKKLILYVLIFFATQEPLCCAMKQSFITENDTSVVQNATHYQIYHLMQDDAPALQLIYYSKKGILLTIDANPDLLDMTDKELTNYANARLPHNTSTDNDHQTGCACPQCIIF